MKACEFPNKELYFIVCLYTHGFIFLKMCDKDITPSGHVFLAWFHLKINLVNYIRSITIQVTILQAISLL